jgi:hypothetical protein
MGSQCLQYSPASHFSFLNFFCLQDWNDQRIARMTPDSWNDRKAGTTGLIDTFTNIWTVACFLTSAEQQLNYLYGHPIAVTPRRYKGKAKNWLTSRSCIPAISCGIKQTWAKGMFISRIGNAGLIILGNFLGFALHHLFIKISIPQYIGRSYSRAEHICHMSPIAKAISY